VAVSGIGQFIDIVPPLEEASTSACRKVNTVVDVTLRTATVVLKLASVTPESVTSAPGDRLCGVVVVTVTIWPALFTETMAPPMATADTAESAIKRPGISPCALAVVIVATPGRFSLLMTMEDTPPPIAAAARPEIWT
jgi:hypothetical protein